MYILFFFFLNAIFFAERNLHFSGSSTDDIAKVQQSSGSRLALLLLAPQQQLLPSKVPTAQDMNWGCTGPEAHVKGTLPTIALCLEVLESRSAFKWSESRFSGASMQQVLQPSEAVLLCHNHISQPTQQAMHCKRRAGLSRNQHWET